jgi:nucleoside-diphosphate-sugar epimerase
VRRESLDKVPELLEAWGVSAERAVPVVGDLEQPLLGLAKGDLKKLAGKVKHFFHLAAVYDLKADADTQIVANIEGTRNAVALANEIKAGVFEHVSSIAAAGMYEGVFREDMFDEAEGLDHPYFATKHDSEKIVRKRNGDAVARLPAGAGGGRQPHRRDGQDRRAVLLLQADPAHAQILPPWMPAVGIEGGRINIVPVDFVVDAIDYIAHRPGTTARRSTWSTRRRTASATS